MTESRVAPWLSASRWPTAPIRLVARLGSGHTPSRSKPEYWNNCTVPWITLADVWQLRDGRTNVITETKEKVSLLGLANSAAVRHPAGTVILSRTASVGFSAIMGCDMATSQDFATWTCGPKLEPRYLLHALRGMAPDLKRVAMGSTHKTIYMPDIEQLRVPLPPLEEQRRIVDFLDIETARITRLTQLREQQLRLRAERARALVSHLVTTGDGAGPRTVDWLGPVPEEWSTPSIGRISRFVMGTTFPHEYQGEKSGDFPFIKVSDFQNADIVGWMQGAENWISVDTARELGARIVPPGSILYARVGAALLLNRRRITTQPSVIDDNVRAICFDHGDPRFWAGILSLLDMGQLVNPGPVPSISESQVSPIRVPDPDTLAQRKIADQLEKSLKQWQKARSLVERQLKLIDERRQALITAAVTGQFDVTTATGRNVTEGVPA